VSTEHEPVPSTFDPNCKLIPEENTLLNHIVQNAKLILAKIQNQETFTIKNCR
jgi:hypothetical protein